MATYLSGSQDLAVECGISNVPADVTTQTGELGRIVRWYKTAYTDIQNAKLWRWLRHDFTITTAADDDTYAPGDAVDVVTTNPIDRFKSWYLRDDYPRIYLQSVGVGGETFLSWLSYETFRHIYKFGNQTSGHPVHITIDPQNNILLGPAPNGVYVVSGQYDLSPQILAADSDVPEMPSQYHDLIVYRAMEKYAGFEAAQEVMVRAQREGGRVWNQLKNNQTQPLKKAMPLC